MLILEACNVILESQFSYKIQRPKSSHHRAVNSNIDGVCAAS